MYVVFMWVHSCMNTGAQGGHKTTGSMPSALLGAGTQIWVFCKNNKWS